MHTYYFVSAFRFAFVIKVYVSQTIFKADARPQTASDCISGTGNRAIYTQMVEI